MRRDNIEISGIPEIFNNKLQEKVIEICNSYQVQVTEKDIEACRRLGKTNKNCNYLQITIVLLLCFVNTSINQ